MSENWKIQINPKLPDGTLLNFRGENPGEMDQIMKWAIEQAPEIIKVVQAFGATTQVAGQIPTQQVTVQPQASGWSNPPENPAPAFAQQAQPPKPSCGHGERVYKNGTGKKGPWEAWFCPVPKGTPGACDPVWV